MSSSCSHMVHCQTETIDQWSLSYNKTLRRITPPEQLRQARISKFDTNLISVFILIVTKMKLIADTSICLHVYKKKTFVKKVDWYNTSPKYSFIFEGGLKGNDQKK